MDQTPYFLTNLRPWALCALLALAGCSDDGGTEQAADSPMDVEVMRPVDAYFKSFNAHSFDNAADFTSDDWNHVTPSGLWARGRPEVVAQLKQVHASLLAGTTKQAQSHAVRFAGSDVAVVVVTSKLSPASTPDQVRDTFVLVRRADKWLLMHDQHSWIGPYQNTDSFGTQVGPPAVQSDAEKAVRAFTTSFNATPASEILKDPDAWFTEDTNLINPSGGWTQNRTAMLAEFQAVNGSFLMNVVSTTDESTVRFAADSVAVVTTSSSSSPYTGPDGVLRKHSRYVTTDVLVNRDGRWLILHSHITSISA